MASSVGDRDGVIRRPRPLVDPARHGLAPAVAHEVIVQRTQELAAALRRSGSARAPASPAGSDAGWRSAARRTGSRCCPTSRSAKARSRSAICAVVSALRQAAEEVLPLLRHPALRVELRRRRAGREPLHRARRPASKAADDRAASRWAGGPARRSTPSSCSVPRAAASFAEQVGAQVGDELVGRHRGEGAPIEPGRAATRRTLARPTACSISLQQRRALVVGDRGHAVVGVAAGERRAAGACPASRRRARRSRRSARGGRALRASPSRSGP